MTTNFCSLAVWRAVATCFAVLAGTPALANDGLRSEAGATVNSVLISGGDTTVEDLRWGEEFGAPLGCDAPVWNSARGPSGEIYLVGGFLACGGVVANRVVRYDPTSGTWSALGDGAGRGVNGYVYSVLVVGQSIYVGGTFSQANVGEEISANGIARFDLDTGRWSALGSATDNGVNDKVDTMALGSDGSIYVGGWFTEVNSGEPFPVKGIARWDPILEQWFALAGSDVLSGGVRAIVLKDDRLWAAETGGVYAYDLVDNWTNMGPGGPEGSISAMAVTADDVYVGGFWTSILLADDSKLQSEGIARWSMSEARWHEVAGGVAMPFQVGTVSTLSVEGQRLYVGGNFATVGSQPPVSANRTAIWRLDTLEWEAFGSQQASGVDGAVLSMVPEGNLITVTGSFTAALGEVGSTPALNVAFWDQDSGSWSAPESDGAHGAWEFGVVSLARLGDEICVGGYFNGAGDQPLNSLGRWNGIQWQQVGTAQAHGGVSIDDVIDFHGQLVVAGRFGEGSGPGQLSGVHVVSWDPASGHWDVLGRFDNDDHQGWIQIYDTATVGDDLYVGGIFSSVTDASGTIQVNHVARWNRLTGQWSALGTDGGNGMPSGNGFNPVSRLLAVGTDLYAGGSFNKVNVGGPLINASNVAKWDGTSWHPLSTIDGVGTSGPVRALAADLDYLYVGGQFGAVDGDRMPALRVARWRLQGGGWEAMGGGLGVQTVVSTNDVVKTMEVVGDWVYAGGRFATAEQETVAVGNLARWHRSGNQWRAVGSGFTPVQNSIANDMVASGDELYLGGLFRLAGGHSSRHIARYSTRGTLDLTISGSGGGWVTSDPVGIACSANCSARFEWDQDITLTAQPMASSSFVGWSGDCSGSGSCTVAFDRARFVGASFASDADLFANDFE